MLYNYFFHVIWICSSFTLVIKCQLVVLFPLAISCCFIYLREQAASFLLFEFYKITFWFGMTRSIYLFLMILRLNFAKFCILSRITGSWSLTMRLRVLFCQHGFSYCYYLPSFLSLWTITSNCCINIKMKHGFSSFLVLIFYIVPEIYLCNL